tara:strand:- start:62 stop:913 length:852 start_codon:yes stop_codon:yes gene_type:complete
MRFDNITIVINTFNSEDKIHECLNSIESKVKVIIIENSNNIKFKEGLEKKYSNLQCFLAGKNLGYAKGNNLGLSKVKSKYALILNPDATLNNDTLEEFLNSAENFSDFAIIGPARQDEYKNFDNKENLEQVFQVNSLKGFAMFLNLEEFQEVGFFDDNFFIYLEEIDLCKRLKKKGKKIYLDRKIIVHHIGGSSHNKKIDFEMELSRNWHWMWSTFYFNKKHFGYPYAIISVGKKFFSSLIKIIFYSLTFNRHKKKIYLHRFLGLFNSIIGNKSWYRPKINNN